MSSRIRCHFWKNLKTLALERFFNRFSRIDLFRKPWNPEVLEGIWIFWNPRCGSLQASRIRWNFWEILRTLALGRFFHRFSRIDPFPGPLEP